MTWFWANKRQFIQGQKCSGCNYTYDWFSMNVASNGLYYCGGCNSDLKDPASPINRPKPQARRGTGERPTQELITFTSTYESEEEKKKEKKEELKPNLKPIEEGIESVKDEEPIIPSGFFDDTNFYKTDEEKDLEAQKYYNNVAFKAYLRKHKFITSLPFTLFRYNLVDMAKYFKEWKEWLKNTKIPVKPRAEEQLANWLNSHVNIKVHEANFYAWMRDVKKVDVEWIMNHGNKDNVLKELATEYDTWQINKENKPEDSDNEDN